MVPVKVTSALSDQADLVHIYRQSAYLVGRDTVVSPAFHGVVKTAQLTRSGHRYPRRAPFVL